MKVKSKEDSRKVCNKCVKSVQTKCSQGFLKSRLLTINIRIRLDSDLIVADSKVDSLR